MRGRRDERTKINVRKIKKKRNQINVEGNKRLPMYPLQSVATDNEVACGCYLNGQSQPLREPLECSPQGNNSQRVETIDFVFRLIKSEGWFVVSPPSGCVTAVTWPV